MTARRTLRLGYLALLFLAGPAFATTEYHVRVDTGLFAGLPMFVAVELVSGGSAANEARVSLFTTDGQRAPGSSVGGPVSGGLISDIPPIDARIRTEYFFSQLLIPLVPCGDQITFDIEVTEHGPVDGDMRDQLAVYLLNSDGTAVNTGDALGANALFAISVSGESGGELTVMSPMQFVGPDSIVPAIPGGGGGCPFIDTRAVAGWQEENSILGRSLDDALLVDGYRLGVEPVVVRGQVQVRVRENEREYTSLDHMQLAVVDHEANVRSFDLGTRFVLGSKVPPHRVTTSDGRDVSSLLSGSGKFYEGARGDTLYIEWVSPSVGFGLQRTMPGEGGGAGGGEGGEKEMELAQAQVLGDPTLDDAGAALDAAILESTGILIQGPDGVGGWRTVMRYYPRAKRGEFTMDSLSSGPIRMIFVGRHRLYSLFRIEPSGETPNRQLLEPASAWHSRLGNVRAAVAGAGGAATALTPRDTITMEFEVPPLPEGKVRDWFFISRGVYSSSPQLLESIPDPEGPRLPTAFALRQNHPNPFRGQTSIRFELPVEAAVCLEIFDPLGRRIRTLMNGTCPAGFHSAEWNQRDEQGRLRDPGVYFYRIRAGSFRDKKKMVLLP